MCRFFVCLIFTALPRRKSLLSIHAWTNIHAAIPQIVGLLLRSARFYSFYRIFISDTHFVCRFFVCLIFTALPRRKSLLSVHAWTNIHAAISQIVGLLLRSARFYSFYRIFISDSHFVCRFFVCLIFTALPRRKSLLSIHAWTNIHAAIPQIVGLLLRSARFYSFFRIFISDTQMRAAFFVLFQACVLT